MFSGQGFLVFVALIRLIVFITFGVLVTLMYFTLFTIDFGISNVNIFENDNKWIAIEYDCF